MNDIRAILLVPSEAYREALLKSGPCGSRPPIASEVPCYDPSKDAWQWDAGDLRGTPTDIRSVSLVLAWDGKPVPEGLDRWWRVGRETDSHTHAWIYRHPSSWADTVEEVATIEPRGLGELVTLQHEATRGGREG